MGVVVDDGIRKEIDQLEATGQFSLAAAFRHANEVSLESLAFQTTVPAEYQALVASTTAAGAMRAQHDERAKREHEDERHFEKRMAELRREELDAQVLRLTINGADIEITRGEATRLMKERVEELEKQRQELLRAGNNPQALNRVNRLIDDYHPVIVRYENNDPIDQAAQNDMQRLATKDAEFGARITHRQQTAEVANTVAVSARTSYSNDEFDGGIRGPSLAPDFARSAAPASPQQTVKPEPDAPDPRQKNLNNTLQAAGF